MNDSQYPFYEPRLNVNYNRWYIVEHKLAVRRNFFGRLRQKKVESVLTEFRFNPDGGSTYLPMFFDSYKEVRAYIKSLTKEILELPDKSPI